MGATASVIASDAPALIRFFGNACRLIGLNVWVCNGVDDDVEIQAAISSLPASGGKLLLSAGNYYITSSIELVGGLTLEGEGKTNTRIYSTVTAIQPANPAVYTNNVQLRNLYILGTGVPLRGLDLDGVAYSSFYDIEVTGFAVGIEQRSSGALTCMYNNY
jgi:hypothetical protein